MRCIMGYCGPDATLGVVGDRLGLLEAGRFLALNDMPGYGMSRLGEIMLTAVAACRPGTEERGIALIDGIDKHLDGDTLSALWHCMVQVAACGAQIFGTACSLDSVRKFSIVAAQKDRQCMLFRLSRSRRDAGQILARSYDADQLVSALDQGLAAWLDGQPAEKA